MGNSQLPCQVCGKPLTAKADGLTRKHGLGNNCPGVGYRHDRWQVGQRLRHHSGSVWQVVENRGGRYRDYLIRCIVGSPWGDSEREGNEMVTHGEYMHRHGWTPVTEQSQNEASDLHGAGQ